MALFKDLLTVKGQRMLAKMLTGEITNLEFTRVVLGDGENRNPEGATEVISPICEAKIESITLNDNNVLSITATFSNVDIENGFYMREKGIYLSDGTEEVLAVYANAGSTAGYIEPAASGVIKKIIRSSIAFSQADSVNITLFDAGYASAVDFDSHLANRDNPHGVTAEDVGLDKVPNVATNDQTPTYTVATTLTELESGEKLSTAFGKIAKAVSSLISHIGNKNKPHVFKITDSTPYTYKVIGLIKLSTWDYCGGTIELFRTNGAVPNTKIEFAMQKKYNTELEFFCSYQVTGQNILQPVIFTYNGIKYAGFYFCRSVANQENIILDIYSYTGFSPFLVQVYNVNTSTVLNEEIYNSLQRGCDVAYDLFSNGTRLLKATDTVKNLTTTTEGNPLDATMGKTLYEYIQNIQTELNKQEIITISIPKATVASGTALAVEDYISSENKTKTIVGCEIIGCYMTGRPGGSTVGDYSVIASSAYYNTNKYMYIGTRKNLSGFAPVLVIKDTGVADADNGTVTVKIRVTYS